MLPNTENVDTLCELLKLISLFNKLGKTAYLQSIAKELNYPLEDVIVLLQTAEGQALITSYFGMVGRGRNVRLYRVLPLGKEYLEYNHTQLGAGH